MTAVPIELQALPAYLAVGQSWTLVRVNEVRSVWRHESGASLFVPLVSGPEYNDLLDVAVARIADVEGRPADDVEIDLTYFRFDTLHVRRVGADRGLSLDDGLNFHQAMHDVIRAAALASHDRRPAYPGGQAVQVAHYLAKVRLIPSLRGSFVARALLPLDVSTPDDEPMPVELPVSDDARDVSTTIVTGAAAAVAAAQEVALGEYAGRRWDEAVAQGVSAEMCDALVRLLGPVGEADDVDLSIQWTWRAPISSVGDLPSRVLVPGGIAPNLLYGRDHLKGRPQDHDVTLLGRVTRLDRKRRLGPGLVTVVGVADELGPEDRTLTFLLQEDEFNRATTALRNGSTVEVRASVIRKPGHQLEAVKIKKFTVKRPRKSSPSGTDAQDGTFPGM